MYLFRIYAPTKEKNNVNDVLDILHERGFIKQIMGEDKTQGEDEQWSNDLLYWI